MKRYKKPLALFLTLLFIHDSIAFAGDESWHKPYRSNFKSAENYTSIKRFHQMEAEERYKIQKRNDVASILKMQQAENARLIEEHAQKMRAANLPKSILPSSIKQFAPKIKPPEKMKFNSDVRKVEAARWEMPKPATPQRNVTVEKKFIDSRQHTVKTVERFDKNGNLTRRDIVDRVRLDKRTTLTTIKTYSPSGDLIRQVEKFKIKAKGGYQIQKFVSTQFDSSGNPLDRHQVTNKFVHKRNFGSILGAALTFGIVGGIIAAADPNFFPKFFQTGLGKIVGIGVQAVGALTGNPLAIAANQFALSLAQGQGFKGALISAGISFGAYIVTAGTANFLQGADLNALGKIGGALKTFGKNLATNLTPAPFSGSPTTFTHSLLNQMAIRAGAERFGEAFGKKLGAFGTAATLSFATAVAGAFAQNNFSPTTFSRLGPQGFADIALRAIAQGGIAEAFKHERGIGAQFFRETASLLSSGVDTEVISKSFQGVTKTFGNTIKFFDPRTEVGQRNWLFGKFISDNGIRPDRVYTEGGQSITGVVQIDKQTGVPEQFALAPWHSYDKNKSFTENVKDLFSYSLSEDGPLRKFASDFHEYLKVPRTFIIAISGAQDTSQGVSFVSGHSAEGHLGPIDGDDPSLYLGSIGVARLAYDLGKIDKLERLNFADQIDNRYFALPTIYKKPSNIKGQTTYNQDQTAILNLYSPDKAESATDFILGNVRKFDELILLGHSAAGKPMEQISTVINNADLKVSLAVFIDVVGVNITAPESIIFGVNFYQSNEAHLKLFIEDDINIKNTAKTVLYNVNLSRTDHVSIDDDINLHAGVKELFYQYFDSRFNKKYEN